MRQDISVVVGGYRWIGEGVRSVGSVILEMIDSTEKELTMTAFILSNYEIIEHLHHALARGVNVRVIMNSPDNQMPEIMQKLRYLENEYPYMRTIGVTDVTMHAKVMVVDRKVALVSSANFTMSGMMKNYEMGLLVDDSEIAQQIENIMLKIWEQ